jgi:retron-type reverse transcriptase
VQAAAKLILEPIFEEDLDLNAYGCRPKRGGLDAYAMLAPFLNSTTIE